MIHLKTQKFFISLTAIFCSFSINAKSIALSFDDGLNPALNAQAEHINSKILQQLKDQNIQTIVFPSLIKIGDAQGKQLIRSWGINGHTIGNHSAFHQNLNNPNVTAGSYIQSIQMADTAFSDLPHYQRIYRFPFLKEGNTAEKRNAVKSWLHENSYQLGAVSIDASDWFYNRKYLDYLKHGDTAKLERLKQAYITHLLDRANYYDQLAMLTLKRSPQHVLLLHVNAINAAFLTDAVRSFQQHGWDFISAKQALQDPLYQQTSQNLPAGESIIWSIAKTQGNTSLRYPAEDAPYETDNLERFNLD
ncbi:polysaccharide deacetylase family protein [Acinetobacter tianfuensis]|uniref:Polysaccharide deacetylase n=1 Tax=Acinetobacter tianfuensis TaxID=2419603 RepID=A0A3A8EVE6_9GAMM|nr:polysaccharide deacetylase family protein [Acinetobacter tianfuensis]RKG34670.1 polysaccharide deacetylase [Acinetobacter tianfuensis]